MTDHRDLDGGRDGRLRRWTGALTGRRIGVAAAIVVGLMLLYYPLGMAWMHTIDDDPAFFADASVTEGKSRAVGLAAALVRREVEIHPWTANDPFFLPTSALDNMPNFQQGIVAALSRFAVEMIDQLGRTRGTSQADPDLERAAGLLKYPGTVWVFDFSVSWTPTATSEKQYRSARLALLDYNRRLAAGQAVFERRADNLLATLERVTADLGSSSASLDRHIQENAGALIDVRADDIFYGVKGRLYAYALLLRELGADYGQVIAERDAQAVWAQMLDSMTAAAALQPWVVVNGSPDGQALPSHLAAQGFFLLRARAQLREITNILLK